MEDTKSTAVYPFTREVLSELRSARAECAKREVNGERFTIPRADKPGIEAIIYHPDATVGSGKIPVFVNMHGGGWVGGDAVLMDSFCTLLSREIPAIVVNVNYRKADERAFPYASEEVCDTVKYLVAHAEEYGVDAERIGIGGHSAGGQLAASAALMLKDQGIAIACQALVYPAVDLSSIDDDEDAFIAYYFAGSGTKAYASPLLGTDRELAGVAPAIFILCGKDELREQGIAYAHRLIDLAVPVKVKEYPEALHGFLEVNRPDYPEGDERQSEEQARYCRDAERYLIRELRASFGM